MPAGDPHDPHHEESFEEFTARYVLPFFPLCLFEFLSGLGLRGLVGCWVGIEGTEDGWVEGGWIGILDDGGQGSGWSERGGGRGWDGMVEEEDR